MSKKRPNVLWLMSDQHNAGAAGFAGNSNLKTPNLDSIAEDGVNFTQAFCNNPICSPSRITFITGKYPNHHQMLGNNHSMFDGPIPEHLAFRFRQYGYQTALVGKSHMVPKWDREAFEHIRYCDLCDTDPRNPYDTHYFQYLVDHGLANQYEEGSPKEGQVTFDGSMPASLPYEHSIEHFTGNESLKFLEERDDCRPFFLKMSFQRPHEPLTPAPEDFDMLNPEDIVLPDSAVDYFENKFASKPQFIQDRLVGSLYPLAPESKEQLQRAVASYFILIMKIDQEIGRVIKHLKDIGEYENTVIFYTADHGDFAGEHGLILKNLGIYESIHRIPFLLKWPGGPKGVQVDELVESVDWFPTLCDLCDVPTPDSCDGKALKKVAEGEDTGIEEIFCEWDWANNERIAAVRTKTHRLVYYPFKKVGELYDRTVDPGEINNLWESDEHKEIKAELMEKVLGHFMTYTPNTSIYTDSILAKEERYCFTPMLQKYGKYYDDLMETYTKSTTWKYK